MKNVRHNQRGLAPDAPNGARTHVTTGGHKLTVSDIMNEFVVTASADERLLSAAKKMLESRVSCVLVTDDDKLAGILTQKDILKAIAGGESNLERIKTSEKMSRRVGVVLPSLSVLAAGRIMETNGIKRLPVVKDQELVGIVTQTDITRGLIFLSPLRSVSDIMSTDVAAVEADATVGRAAQIMSRNNISCILVTNQQEVAGILTERDLLDRVVIPRKHPTRTKVGEVMSRPVTWVPPSCSVLGAAQKMDQMHLHRLVVMDRKQLCGIVTQTDIMRAVRKELEQAQAKQGSAIRGIPADLSELAAVWHTVPEQVKAAIRTLVRDSAGKRSNRMAAAASSRRA